MLNLCISAIASNQGKTILTTALLYHYRESVRPYKIGPDFIDPQFHKRVCGRDSINLDSYMMNENQVKYLYRRYSDQRVSILEGVMGFYDGDDKGCSAYSVSTLLDIPTVVVIDGSGSYITISALLLGLLRYRDNHTIKAIVLNKLSSPSHYQLIKDRIAKDHPDIVVLGWIKKGLASLGDTHLGLDLGELDRIESISQEVLEHIDIEALERVASKESDMQEVSTPYPFEPIPNIDRHLCVVNDTNFSFLYHDNLQFLREAFRKVTLIDASSNQPIPAGCDSVYICGGYVESEIAYSAISSSYRFRDSLIAHARGGKKIYAECAGLLYLSNRVDEKLMSGILDIEFTLESRAVRLGYYFDESRVKGHAFHYTRPTTETLQKGYNTLRKIEGGVGEVSSWSSGQVVGTYLHTMFRNHPSMVERYL